MTRRRYLAIMVVVLAVLVSFVTFSSFGQEKKVQKAGFVGSETCEGCHQETYDGFKKTDPHWKILVDEEKGCESCHGPGEKHANSEGKEGFDLSFKTSDAHARSEACLSCHQKKNSLFQSLRSVHKVSSVACNECHQSHAAKVTKSLLKQKDPDLCFSCHGEVKAKFYLPNNHRVIQGALKCSDCHTPHGSRNRASLRKMNRFDTDVCFNCHPEKRGPWVFEHGVQKFEGCNVCHYPHGSPNRFLLIRRDVRTLCIECHGQVHFPKFSCINCHNQIHGSNFSSRFLQ